MTTQTAEVECSRHFAQAGDGTQRLVDREGCVYARVPLVAGPFEFTLDDVTFQLGVVRLPDDEKNKEPKRLFGIIHVQSGALAGGKVELKARNYARRTEEARPIVAARLKGLKERFGAAEVAKRFREAKVLPEHAS